MRHKTDDDIKLALREIRRHAWRLKIEAFGKLFDSGIDLAVVAVVLLMALALIGNIVVAAFPTP